MNAEFVDTNVVLYSLSDDVAKRRRALVILLDRPVLSLQVLNEAANIMRRKLGLGVTSRARGSRRTGPGRKKVVGTLPGEPGRG